MKTYKNIIFNNGSEQTGDLVIPANANKVQLVILSNSHTRLKRGLRGHVQNPTYSFLYYMLDGELSICSKEGQTVSLTKENCYLLPAGYSKLQGPQQKKKDLYLRKGSVLNECFF